MNESDNTYAQRCPLCDERSSLTISKHFSVRDIIKIYKIAFRVDTSSEFGNAKEVGLYLCGRCGLRFFYPRIVGSSGFYKALSKQNWYYPVQKDEYSYAAKWINPKDKVLDVGCGAAHFSKLLTTGSYHGLELSDVALDPALASKVFREPIESYAEKHGDEYDVVCAFQVLEHVDQVYDFAEACIKCLRKGGLLIISVPSSDSFLSLEKNSVLNMPPHHVNHFTENSLSYLSHLFPITVQEIYHEKLQEEHLVNYFVTTLNVAVLGTEKLLYPSRLFFLWNKMLRFVGHMLAIRVKDSRLLPMGHTVTYVFRKM
jgi:SAM-dependent methyltransferase